jgi:hypothetical protein
MEFPPSDVLTRLSLRDLQREGFPGDGNFVIW